MTLTWQPLILIVQLFSVFFVPPVAIGGRQIFFSDIWCMLWVAVGAFGFVRRARTRAWLMPVSISITLFALIWAHGAFRISLADELYRKAFFALKEGDRFQPLRELFIAARFLSWICGGALVLHWFGTATAESRRRALDWLGFASAAVLGVELLLLVADWQVPGFRAFMGSIYAFNPDHEWWRTRSYGSFQSPVEAGITMSFAGLVLLLSPTWTFFARISGAVSLVLGIALTKTLTALLGTGIVFGALGADYVRRSGLAKTTKAVFFVLFVGAGFLGIILLNAHPEYRAHFNDFFFRFGLWEFYFRALTARWHSLLLGFGFVPYHTDNGYVFVFIRGGIVFVMAASVIATKLGRRYWAASSRGERAAVFYLFVAAWMFDAFTYRHIVAVLFALALPMLASRTNEAKEHAEA